MPAPNQLHIRDRVVGGKGTGRDEGGIVAGAAGDAMDERREIAMGRDSPQSPPVVWTKISPVPIGPTKVMIQVVASQTPIPITLLDRHVQEREQGGQGRRESLIQCEELAGELRSDPGPIVLRLELKVGFEEVSDGDVGGCLAVGDPVAFE
jgi:hypothetical protein